MDKKKTKAKPLRYFFFNGDLHKKIHINRSADIITAWNYPKGEMAKYVYTDVKRNGQKAFTTAQVCEMMNRNWITLHRAIVAGNIHRPQFTYSLDENRNMYAYYWREEDVMDLLAYLQTVHIGRPRKDGMVTPSELPTASELRAMMRHGTVFYTKVGEEFVPTWRAEKF